MAVEEKNKEKKLKLSSSKLTLKSPDKLKLSNVGSIQEGKFTVEVKRRRRASDEVKEVESSSDVGKNFEDGLTDSELSSRIDAIKQAEEDKLSKKEEEKEKEKEKSKNILESGEDKQKPKKEDIAESPVPLDVVDQEFDLEGNANKNKIKGSIKKEVDEEVKRPSPKVVENKRRSSGRITLSKVLYEEDRVRSFASIKRSREKAKRSKSDTKGFSKRFREVIVPDHISVQQLANRMAERSSDVIKQLSRMGIVVKQEELIDADTAEILIAEFGHKCIRIEEADIENILLDDDTKDIEENMLARPLVVTLMGHVDHGKTSLLDVIRNSDIALGEKGGITQHIGAYQITTNKNNKITFIDTPGHEAFTEMRKRGAIATDIVVLVVAADDGVMEQTREAINHAKAAEVTIVVAINKVDKPTSDVKKVKESLLECDLVLEEYGGNILSVEVSAKENINIDVLLETLLLQAEVMELRANPNRKAFGVVIESSVDKQKGPLSTVLVKKGTLRVGDIIVSGHSWGKVRAMSDSEGNRVTEALPSFPVSIIGLDSVPEAGSQVSVVNIEKEARDICDYRIKLSRSIKAAKEKKSSIDELFEKISSNILSELPIVIKADTQGSLEAIVSGLEKIGTDEVSVKFLHTGVGGITTSDIVLAKASEALVIGFNVRPENSAKEKAFAESLDIKLYSIIYDLINDMKALLSGMLKPIIKENYMGSSEVREVFNLSKGYRVAGCYVRDGIIKKTCSVRLIRDNIVIYQGKLRALKRFKNDVKEVSNSFECGISFENYEDIKVGDVIEAFEIVEENRVL